MSMRRMRLQTMRMCRLPLAALLLAVLCLGSGCLLPTIESQSGIPTVNTLTIFGSNPLTLDPAISQEADSHTYILQIFSGLVTLDQNMDIVPDIAQSWTVETTAQGSIQVRESDSSGAQYVLTLVER